MGTRTGENFELDPKTGYLTPSAHYKLTGFTSDKKREWIERYRTTGNIGKVCQQLGMARDTFYKHLQLDGKFEKDFKEQIENRCDDIEETIADMSKKNVVACFGYLRAYRPRRWNPGVVIEQEKREHDRETQRIIDAIPIDEAKREDTDNAP